MFGSKKETAEKHPLDVEIESVIESLKSYSPDTEDYHKAVESLERLTALRKDLYGEPKKTGKEVLKGIGVKIFDGITDPRVVVGVVTSAVYVWWGKLCMYYDREGNIPPNRMLSNGPKPPKQF